MDRSRNGKDMLARMDVGPFVDAEMLADLEPTLNRHFLGTPKNTKSFTPKTTSTSITPPTAKPKTKPIFSNYSSFNHDQKLPPLPTAPSSSDVYTKKIASFKQKLKSFKGVPGNYSETRKLKSPRVISNTATSDFNHSNYSRAIRVNTSHRDLSESQQSTPVALNSSNNIESALNNLTFRGKSVETLIDENINFASSLTFPNSETTSQSSHQIPQAKRTTVTQDKCALCDIQLDTFYNIQDGERIIELQCRHMVHEECLFMEVELNLSMKNLSFTDASVVVDYLPNCNFCKNNEKCIPREDQVLNNCVTHLISMNMGKSNHNIYAASPLTPTFSDLSKYMDSENTSTSHTTVGVTPPPRRGFKDEGTGTAFTPSPVRNPKLETTSNLKQTPPLSKPFKGHSKKSSRGSFALGHSSVVSSVDLDHDNDNDGNNSQVMSSFLGYNHFSDSDFKRKLVRDLTNLSIQNIITPIDGGGFNLSAEFIRSLGEFRIVDKINMLDCSESDNLIVIENYCYLFEHMLLTISCINLKFKLININRSSYINQTEAGSITIKASMSSKRYYKLLFNSKELELKWKDALADMKKRIEPNLTTSTLKMNEFDHLLNQSRKSSIIDDVTTIGTLQSYIGEDGYRRLPTGVSPRFYEGTINSLIFQEKPSKAIIIVNQNRLVKSSMAPVRNMIKSLSMIGIDILLILCSTSALSENSNVFDSYELSKKDLRRKEEELMQRIEDYESFLEMRSEFVDDNLDLMKHHGTQLTIGELARNYIDSAPLDMDYDEILNITVSNTTLKNFKDSFTNNRIFIEVGLDARQKTNSTDIVDLAGWEDIMEVVCVYCGLEFDESDFYVSSGDELNDDELSDYS